MPSYTASCARQSLLNPESLSFCSLNPQSSIPSRFSPTETILTAWIVGLSGTISAGWILSAADALRYDWAAALLIWAAVIAFALHVSGFTFQVSHFRSHLSSLGLLFPPFVIFVVVIFASAFLYLPVTHDSLSYRIPRMFLWLQEGHVGYVPTSDPRINYMTHNWELASLPVLQIGGVQTLPLVSVISWILLYLLGRSWAGFVGFRNNLQNWMGLLPGLTTCAILQSRSTVNDLFAATLILASAWFVFSHKRPQDKWKVVLSAFALALACGAKPHYIVLGLPWILWFVFGRPSPWRTFPWRQLAWLLPLLLFVSPLSAFIINAFETGSYKGMTEGENFIGGNPILNVIFGSFLFLWQSFQPPLNPVAGIWNRYITGISVLDMIARTVPRFSMKASYSQIVDFATVGLFVMVACIIGWRQSFGQKTYSGLRWLAAAGVLGFLLAVSQVVPNTIGRSFMGFFFLAFPLALSGLYTFRPRLLALMLAGTVASAGISLAFDASRPLIPTKTLTPMLGLFGETTGTIALLLDSFTAFRDRAGAGVELFRQIPNRSRVAIISGAGDPLVAVWTDMSPVSVHLAPTDATLKWAKKVNPDYIVVTGTGPEMHGDLLAKLSSNYRLVDTRFYIVRLQRGKEKWELYEQTKPLE